MTRTAAARIIGGRRDSESAARQPIRGQPVPRPMLGSGIAIASRPNRRGRGSLAPEVSDSFTRMGLGDVAEYDGKDVARYRLAGVTSVLAGRSARDAAEGAKPLHCTYRTEAGDAAALGLQSRAGLQHQGLVHTLVGGIDGGVTSAGSGGRHRSAQGAQAAEGPGTSAAAGSTGIAVHVDSERRNKQMKGRTHRQRLRRAHEDLIQAGITAKEAANRLADVRRVRSIVRQRLDYKKRVFESGQIAVHVVPAGSGMRGFVSREEVGKEAVETQDRLFLRGNKRAVGDASRPFAALAADQETGGGGGGAVAGSGKADSGAPRHRPRSVPATPHIAVRDGAIVPDAQLRQATIRERLRAGAVATLEGQARPGAARNFPVCDASVFVGDTFAWFRHDG